MQERLGNIPKESLSTVLRLILFLRSILSPMGVFISWSESTSTRCWVHQLGKHSTRSFLGQSEVILTSFSNNKSELAPTGSFTSKLRLAPMGSFTSESKLASMSFYYCVGYRLVLSSSTYFWIPSLDYDDDKGMLY